jgi:phosphatidylglycerol:prolipoprotein diacylglycerol transferase
MFPIIAKFGPIVIRSYGLMIALGVIAGYFAARVRAKKIGLTDDHMVDLLFYLLIFCVIGAKLMYVLTNDFLFYFHNPIEIIKSGGEGLSFFGIIPAGILVAIVYAKIHKINIWALLDVLASGVLIGYAIGRIGCFFNGCCIGLPSDSWFSFRFGAMDYPRLPTQLFTSVLAFLGFLHVYHIERTKRFYGKTTGFLFIDYAIMTFFIEFWRDVEKVRFLWNILSASQWLAIALIPVGLFILLYCSQNHHIMLNEPSNQAEVGLVIDANQDSDTEVTEL